MVPTEISTGDFDVSNDQFDCLPIHELSNMIGDVVADLLPGCTCIAQREKNKYLNCSKLKFRI